MTRSISLALSSLVLAAFVVASVHAQATTPLSATFGVAIPDVASQSQDSITARKLLQGPNPCTYCAGQPKQPVCGKNGKTYDNYCLATCIKQPIVYFGACNPKPCLCPPFFAPVCGGGKSYYSPCHANCAGAKGAKAGLCPADCKCPSTKATVTGYDGKVYDNMCKAGCAGTEVAYSGTPDARLGSCKCNPDYNPVCEQTIKVYPSPYPGLPETKVPINITHLNPCIAACKGAKATKPGPCSDYIKYDTKSFTCGCSVVFDPVCATIPVLGTTITLSSKCAANCSGFNKTVPGICPGCICPAEAKPVCAGKKTYKTACAARCEGGATTWTEGPCTPCSKCPKPTGLPSDYVCTTSKQTLPSACLAECVGETVASKGMCTYTGR